MDKAALLAEQYADASNLSTRGEFNGRFTVADRHPHEWVRDQVSLPDDATVLDLGCGPGPFWAVNAGDVPTGWTAVAADFSRGMATDARERLAECPVDGTAAVADAERLPFADGSFDAVLALQMLYHLPDRQAALAELRRVLAPDGRLYASTGSLGNARALYELMGEAAGGQVDTIAGGFTAENGAEVLGTAFDDVERRVFENEVRADDPDALVAYALSLPLDDPAVSAFDPEDADALRALAAERIERDGAVRWQKDYALFVADP
jgi:SAM-dependent methyltransferase